MTAILVLHGPNLNLLGEREPQVYGTQTLEEINRRLMALGDELGVQVRCFQSNHEGALIDALHEARHWADGVVINPGGYGQVSIALRDAIAAIGLPAVECHLSNLAAREAFRQHSLIAGVCVGSVMGFGALSYELAMRGLVVRIAQERCAQVGKA